MATDRILTLNEDNFDEQVTKIREPILVDFWATWCPPCEAIASTLEQLAQEMDGRAYVAKVNVDESGDLANRFGIRSIPTLMLFKHGKVVSRVIGAAPKAQIRKMVEKHLG